MPERHRLQITALERLPGALKTILSEGVVLVKHGNPRDAQVFGKPGNHFLRFLVVRCPQVNDGFQFRIAQEFRTGERSDKRRSGRVRNWSRCS